MKQMNNYIDEVFYQDDALLEDVLSSIVLAGGSVADPMATPKRYTAIMKKFNVTVANHPQLDSILLPIGDVMTVSKVIK